MQMFISALMYHRCYCVTLELNSMRNEEVKVPSDTNTICKKKCFAEIYLSLTNLCILNTCHFSLFTYCNSNHFTVSLFWHFLHPSSSCTFSVINRQKDSTESTFSPTLQKERTFYYFYIFLKKITVSPPLQCQGAL